MGSSVCKLSHSNAFTSTPIGGYSASAGTYGSIYVPASLLTAYKTATNWTYFSSRFVGVTTLITFTIDNNVFGDITHFECQAEAGMTWAQWVNSEYNTIGANYTTEGYSNNGIYLGESIEQTFIYDPVVQEYVHKTDVIVADRNYEGLTY
jgi:hypothetical protein